MNFVSKTYDNCIHREVCDYQDVPCDPDICPCYEHNKFQYLRGYNFACFEIIKNLKETGVITQETADKITKSLPNILKGLK